MWINLQQLKSFPSAIRFQAQLLLSLLPCPTECTICSWRHEIRPQTWKILGLLDPIKCGVSPSSVWGCSPNKTNECPLKNSAWRTSLSFWNGPVFRGHVSFRGCNYWVWKNKKRCFQRCDSILLIDTNRSTNIFDATKTFHPCYLAKSKSLKVMMGTSLFLPLLPGSLTVRPWK